MGMPGTPLAASVAADLTRDLVATSGTTARVDQPFTGTRLHDLPLSSVDDVARAASAARLAQRDWAARTPAERRRILLAAHDLLLERRALLLDAVQSETGKTRGQAFEEVFQGAAATRYSALTAASVMAPQRRRGGIPGVVRATVLHRPKGLIGVITPWNYPLSLALMDVIPALATGNAVLQKADEQGALSVLGARRAFIDAGLPSQLWAVVAGDGETIGNAVTDSVDFVCFTGSTATGARVAARAAARLIGSSMELGGKNPLLVLDDVDPERAAADATYACFSSMGQLCVSIERIYVERPVSEAFLAAFVRRTEALAQGAAYDHSTDVGSLTTPAQLERVNRHIRDAIERGATVLTGGTPRPDLGPLFFAPTILTDVTADMLCVREETFGAVVTVTVIDDEDAAVRAANDSEFGLNAAVFSGSRPRARRVAARLEAGGVNINEGYRATFGSIDAPMGGMKQSGLGRRNGREGLLRFLESTTIGEATGVLKLPNRGLEWQRLEGTMLLLLRSLRLLRRG
jgi:succinate-semialdehyde dehydrogenase/glutarate-semialdehyde dehydrogenase